MASSGPTIHKALQDAGLLRLWNILTQITDSANDFTQDMFFKVFLKWLGIDDALQSGLATDRALSYEGVCI
jgi:hypothetical protein